jgi:hypothetical protein
MGAGHPVTVAVKRTTVPMEMVEEVASEVTVALLHLPAAL